VPRGGRVDESDYHLGAAGQDGLRPAGTKPAYVLGFHLWVLYLYVRWSGDSFRLSQ
jgi:hypothetical protein